MSNRFVRKLIDIGANLTDPMFKGIYHSSQKHHNDFDLMLERAKENGVEKIIITGGTLSESKEALSISQHDQNLFTTVGCHPTRCNDFLNHESGPETYLNELRDLIKRNSNKVVAVGEIGLDYDRLHFCSKETQKTYFEQQLTLAQDAKLPLFLHNRNSTNDFVEILNRNKDKFMSKGGVVHSFDGSPQDLEKILNLDLHIGINGCSLKAEKNLEVVKLIPKDKLLIETDCPWCEIRKTHASYTHVTTKFQKSKNAADPKLPVKDRNEPLALKQVLEVLSSIRQEDIENLAEQIYYNTNKLFTFSSC